MRVHFAALPVKSKIDDGFGGAAIAAAGHAAAQLWARLCSGLASAMSSPLLCAALGSPLLCLCAELAGCVAGGIGGGGPHITRFICSATLSLTSAGAAVGRAARTLDHGHINSSVPMGYM